MAYVNYMAIDARCIVVEAGLDKSAVDRLSRNTDLRYDELTNRTAVRQIKEALGSHKIKDKGARQGAKHVLALLTAIYPETAKDEQEGDKAIPVSIEGHNNDTPIDAIEEAKNE